MAIVDYYDVKNTISEILGADTTLAGVSVTVDEDISLESFGSTVNVEISRRDPSPPGQSLSGGQKQRYYVTAIMSVVCVSLEKDGAVKSRDRIVGDVELILMRNRSLNGKVNTLFLQGGELFLLRSSSQNTEGFFVAAGEVVVFIDVELSTV